MPLSCSPTPTPKLSSSTKVLRGSERVSDRAGMTQLVSVVTETRAQEAEPGLVIFPRHLAGSCVSRAAWSLEPSL